MAKHQSAQRYIFKVNTSTLKEYNWNMNMTINEAKENEQIVALADSTTLRFIDDIRNINSKEREANIKKIRQEISILKKLPCNHKNIAIIKKMFQQLNELSFVKDYMFLVVDNKTDYKRAIKGFYINGIKFVRLLGTTGGLKNSTVVFVAEDIYCELNRKLENGRNMEIPFIPSKYNAYLALSCSSSIPVTNTDKVIVVKDCVTYFNSKYIELKDNENNSNEPILEEKESIIEYDANDGFGLISPKMAKVWSNDLELDYVFSGCCTRNSFCKGMLYTFDFHSFAKQIAKNDIIIDIWGNKKNIFEAEIILTESMLKLWHCYSSFEGYRKNCDANGYTFSVTKVTPKKLDNVRNMNYQFLQSYNLTDNEIDELIEPTIKNITDVLHGDINKTILFLKGFMIGEKTIENMDCDFAKALMIEERLINDGYIQHKIKSMLARKINDAKMGVIQVNGNFSLISGDPYSLCQSMFNMEVTGLLKANQFYSKYWCDKGVNEVVAFRSPMSCANNIRKLKIVTNQEIEYWYRYMGEVTIFNSFDLTNMALNGCDFDGDLVFTTNNDILLKNTRNLLALNCTQKKGEKSIINTKKLIKADMLAFGDDIGSITNKITSMFDLLSLFDINSKEYKTLEYRIMCGQKFQQESIDKIKGIVAKPMPKEWYKYSSNLDCFNKSILADKKPYFFIYNYPKLKSDYTKFQKNVNSKCLLSFGKTLKELLSQQELSLKEQEFLTWYNIENPVTINNCLMNRLCRKVEFAFEKFKKNQKESIKEFDVELLKNNNITYSQDKFEEISELYKKYLNKLTEYHSNIKKSKNKSTSERTILENKFKQEAYCVCNNKYELCNILLDLCYSNNSNKQFTWFIVGDVIVENLLKKNDYKINYLVENPFGNIEYNGLTFSKKVMVIKNEET